MNRKIILVASVLMVSAMLALVTFLYAASGRRGASNSVPDVAVDVPGAPELASGTWINSDPLTLKELRGRVVLLEFWTYACYNCTNTLPTVKGWDERYRDRGLTIIGVHSPEFDDDKRSKTFAARYVRTISAIRS